MTPATETSMWKNNQIGYILMIVAALAIGSLFFTVPRIQDDYWYMQGMRDLGVLGTAIDHHLNDNSRIPNLFGAVLVSLPLWLLSVISTIAVAVTLVGSLRLVGADRRSWLAATFIMLAYSFILPWRDYLFCGMFTYNYIWTGALLIVALWMFLRERPLNSFLTLFIGMLLGAWHEIFSFPLLIGAIVCFSVHPQMIRRDRIWLCVGLLVGCAWLWLSPSRHTSTGFGSLITMSRPWRFMVGSHWFSFCFLILEAICLIVKPFRKYALAPIALIAVCFSVICIPVHLLSGALRSIVPAVIIDCIAILYIASRIIGGREIKFEGLVKGVSILAWIFFLAHIIVAFTTGMKIRHDEDVIMARYLESKAADGVVFYNPVEPSSAPWLACGKPFQIMYAYFTHPQIVADYHNGSLLKVIPSELSNYRGEGEPIAGNVGARIYKGQIIAPYSEAIESVMMADEPMAKIKIVYGDGHTKGMSICYPFTGADSVKYVWLKIWN